MVHPSKNIPAWRDRAAAAEAEAAKPSPKSRKAGGKRKSVADQIKDGEL